MTFVVVCEQCSRPASFAVEFGLNDSACLEPCGEWRCPSCGCAQVAEPALVGGEA